MQRATAVSKVGAAGVSWVRRARGKIPLRAENRIRYRFPVFLVCPSQTQAMVTTGPDAASVQLRCDGP
jgi:hypothetical protein